MRSSRPSSSRNRPLRPKQSAARGARNASPNTLRSELQILWPTWQALSPKPALDKWLRQNKSSKQNLNEVLARNEALMYAVRFQELACALETLLHNSNTDLSAWDATWSDDLTTAMHPYCFWYWIELRSQRDWGFVRNVRNQEQRLALFKRLEAHINSEPLSPLALLWHGVRPQWLPLLQQRAKQSGWSKVELERFVRMQNHQPPLWLRVNELMGEATSEHIKTIQQSLLDSGVSVQLRQDNLCAMGGAGITQSEAFKEGFIEIQDLASQQIAAALNVQPGEKVWDTCAGAGGKSLAMASRMNNKGALVATDLHSYKLDELKRRASRAGARNIRTFIWNGTEPLRLPVEAARQGGFDKVLVDAPCSASGTWRRNPDARWNFNPDSLHELLALQQQLLTQAAPAVRSGGLLAYATCSWLLEENEQQVSAFVKASGFELIEQRMLGAPSDDSDCMFVAILKKP